MDSPEQEKTEQPEQTEKPGQPEKPEQSEQSEQSEKPEPLKDDGEKSVPNSDIINMISSLEEDISNFTQFIEQDAKKEGNTGLFKLPIMDDSKDKGLENAIENGVKSGVSSGLDSVLNSSDLSKKKKIADDVEKLVVDELVKRMKGNPSKEDLKKLAMFKSNAGLLERVGNFFKRNDSSDNIEGEMTVNTPYKTATMADVNKGDVKQIPDEVRTDKAVITVKEPERRKKIVDEELDKELEEAKVKASEIKSLIEGISTSPSNPSKKSSTLGGAVARGPGDMVEQGRNEGSPARFEQPAEEQKVEEQKVEEQKGDDSSAEPQEEQPLVRRDNDSVSSELSQSLENESPSPIEATVVNVVELQLPSNTSKSIRQLVEDVRELKKTLEARTSSNILDILKIKGVRRLAAISSVISVGQLMAFTFMALNETGAAARNMDRDIAIDSAAVAIPSVLLFAAREIYTFKKDRSEISNIQEELDAKQMELFDNISFLSGSLREVQELKQEKGDLFRNYSEPVPKASPLVSPDDDTTGAVSYPLTSSERKKITGNIIITQGIIVEPSVSYLNQCVMELMQEYRTTVRNWSSRQNSIPLDDFIETYPRLSLIISKICIIIEHIPPTAGYVIKNVSLFLLKTTHQVLYELGLYKWVVGLSAVYLTRHQLLYPVASELGQRGAIYILNSTLSQQIKSWATSKLSEWAQKISMDIAEKTAVAAAEAARQAAMDAAQEAAKQKAQQELQNSIFKALTDPQNLQLLTNGAQFAGDTVLRLTTGMGGGDLLDTFKNTKKRRRKQTKRKKKVSKKKKRKPKSKTNRRKRKKSKKKRKGKR
tara:strand:- start:14668 stop:17136 length:2469 start_codon:yes stop_codon:yes gene_type:complete